MVHKQSSKRSGSEAKLVKTENPFVDGICHLIRGLTNQGLVKIIGTPLILLQQTQSRAVAGKDGWLTTRNWMVSGTG